MKTSAKSVFVREGNDVTLAYTYLTPGTLKALDKIRTSSSQINKKKTCVSEIDKQVKQQIGQ